jgi:hypothetical protein
MLFKHKDNENVIEINDKNLVSMLEREGFELVEGGADEELEALRKQAKELGIKSAHTMKKETLFEKIAEINK